MTSKMHKGLNQKIKKARINSEPFKNIKLELIIVSLIFQPYKNYHYLF
jgi:hypothetical protein